MVKKSQQSATAQAAPRSAGPRLDPPAFPRFAMPQIDAETMATAQRRNVEALTAVYQLACDCVQVSAQRQAQVLRDTTEEVLSSFRGYGKAENPQDQAAAGMAVNRHAFERGMESMRSLAELMARANADAFEIINKRAVSCLQELQSAVKPEVAPTAKPKR